MTVRNTHKVLNQRVLVMGIDTKLFYVVLGMVFAFYMLSGRRGLLSLGLFVTSEFLAFLITRKYGEPIAVLSTMWRIKHRYDATKHTPFEVRVIR